MWLLASGLIHSWLTYQKKKNSWEKGLTFLNEAFAIIRGVGKKDEGNVMLESNNNPEEGTALVVSKPHGAEGTVVAVTANAGNLGRSEVESIKTPNKETDLTLNNFRY